jgi:shikimate kinase / 3-dehydroquinate synthase
MRRPLLLSGFMGTGKSTLGRRVAQATGRPFVDLDARIEHRLGKPVKRIFAEDGEPAFRRAEADALREVLESAEACVVALGGGALLRRSMRLSAIDRAVVVTLEATPTAIAARTAKRGARPLLDVDDPAARIAELLEQRASAYAECHARLATYERSPRDLAADLAEIWARDPLAVAAGDASYAVDVGRGIAGPRAAAALEGASSAFIVSDTNVAPLHAAPIRRTLEGTGISVGAFTLEAGEEHKTPATLSGLWTALLEAGTDRKARLLGLGGGVVTDVSGFAAATWMRGIQWVALPSTLLAMVDASVGGKTAVDLPGAKNVVGAFWQPRAVVCDVDLLETEPERGYVSALAEVVKTALIGDAALLELVEREAAGARARSGDLLVELVRRSIRVKARIVSADEREGGLRACLNLGHTVGHALEAYGGYGRLRHGEAVSLGLVAALGIGEALGVTPPDLTRRTKALLSAIGLPAELSTQPVAEALELLDNDKKRAGSHIRFVVARDVGDVDLVTLPVSEVKQRCLELLRLG